MEKNNDTIKSKIWQIAKRILLFIVPMIIKNQKGIKGTKNEEVVDDIKKELE